MKNITKILAVIFLVILFSTGCDVFLSTQVRFENRSETKTVKAIWDGINMGTLAPGEITEYREVNPGTHTIKWKNAANGKDLTSLGYPSLVEGKYLTFHYSD